MAWRVRWTDPAWEHLKAAAEYIARDSPRYADVLISDARAAARSLREFPNRGHVVSEWNDPAVREVNVQMHRLIYRVFKTEREVRVLAFVHGARDLAGLIRRGEL